MSVFLDDEDVVKLTGKKKKSCQVDVLSSMGILFYINAAGRPVVPISAINSKEELPQKLESWQPRVLMK